MTENKEALPDTGAEHKAPPRAAPVEIRIQKYKNAVEAHSHVFIIHSHAIHFVDNYFRQSEPAAHCVGRILHSTQNLHKTPFKL